MTSAVLDASALLALLLNEPGGDRVRAALPDCAISTVNFAEVIGHFTRREIAIETVRTILGSLRMERVDFDEALAFAAAELLPVSRPLGLSLGDRACLALAIQLNAPALTADRGWAQLPNVEGLTVTLIR